MQHAIGNDTPASTTLPHEVVRQLAKSWLNLCRRSSETARTSSLLWYQNPNALDLNVDGSWKGLDGHTSADIQQGGSVGGISTYVLAGFGSPQ